MTREVQSDSEEILKSYEKRAYQIMRRECLPAFALAKSVRGKPRIKINKRYDQDWDVLTALYTNLNGSKYIIELHPEKVRVGTVLRMGYEPDFGPYEESESRRPTLSEFNVLKQLILEYGKLTKEEKKIFMDHIPALEDEIKTNYELTTRIIGRNVLYNLMMNDGRRLYINLSEDGNHKLQVRQVTVGNICSKSDFDKHIENHGTYIIRNMTTKELMEMHVILLKELVGRELDFYNNIITKNQLINICSRNEFSNY